MTLHACLPLVKQILAKLVSFPTISSSSNMSLIQYVANYLCELGARTQIFTNVDNTKANVLATFGPEGDGGIVLSGHTDVVPIADQNWSSDPFTLREHDNKLYARGSCDMKGFIACALALAPTFANAALQRPIHFAFTYDEEVGCLGAKQLVKDMQTLALRPAIAIVGEPTNMCVVEGNKGICEYQTTIRGLEGHSSLPSYGVNAIEYATLYMHYLLGLRDRLQKQVPQSSTFIPPYTTINIGEIKGGIASNVIASSCTIEWEMRPVQPQDIHMVLSNLTNHCNKHLLPNMQAVYPQAAIQTTTLGEITGLVPMDGNAARELVTELTGEKVTDVVSFCTEAGLFQEMGIDCVICGPGSIRQAHKVDEYVEISQLQSCLEMLEKLAIKMS